MMFSSIKSHIDALPFIFKNGLAKYFLYALCITVFVFAGGAIGVSYLADWLNNQLAELLDHYHWLPDWAAWLQSLFYWIFWIIIRVTLYFVMAFIGGSLILLLMSPILTLLSDAVAVRLGNQKVDFSFTQFIRDFARAAGLALKNGVIQIILSILCFFIGLIPMVGIVAPFLLFTLNAYFFGFNFIDYSLERKRLTATESTCFIWKNKVKTIILGTPFALWLLIPFIGSLTSGFIAVISTVAATIDIEKSNYKG